MSLAPGTHLGPYEVVSPLGAGGMGEVYKAKDTRLDRIVAVKVLPEALAASSEVRQRFEREAKAISRLSHPHICALYDVGREGETEYLVMEFLEGETLADRLAKGALPPELTLRSGIQIADALDKAHRQGIVHRDLKPGNVMLTNSGLKLVDFGLAKMLAPEAPPDSLTSAPTAMKDVTAEGTILGTLSYMAPEQLEGKPADARTDIFALGAVLFQMATGRKAFEGASRASLISAIMQNEPPPVSSVSPVQPPALDRIVRTCLAKDPEERWQSAGDVAKELKWVAEGSGGAATERAVPRGRRRERLPWAVAAIAASIAAASILIHRPDVREAPSRLLITPPPGQKFFNVVALSRDGRRIVFDLRDDGGGTFLGIRSLDSLEIRRLPGTENAHNLFLSPDGRDVAFCADGKLKKTSADGGPVQTICDAVLGIGGSWNSEGTILIPLDFGAPVSAVSASGGPLRAVTALDEARGDVAHVYPAFLPDGRHFVFVARNRDPEKTSIMIGSLDSKDSRPLFRADSAAIYTDPGYLLFARDDALFAWKFDPRDLKLEGEPVPLLEGIRYGTEGNLLSVSASADRVVYLPWSLRKRLVRVDRKGREVGVIGGVGAYEDVRFSPDGRRVAVAERDPKRGQNVDVWVFDAGRGTGVRITNERTDEFDPAWFPDGKRLVYVSDHAGFYDLYERPADGGNEKVLVRTKQDKVLPTVSPDGRWLIFGILQGSEGLPVRAVAPADGEGQVRQLSAGSPFLEQHPEISPDGRWTAFESRETGAQEIFVQPLPGGPKQQISIGGGRMPVWRRDGEELFYVSRDGMLMSVAIRTPAGRLEAGEPQPLFPSQIGVGGEGEVFRRPYDVAPDGQTFLLVRSAPGPVTGGAVVVTNWTALIGRSR